MGWNDQNQDKQPGPPNLDEVFKKLFGQLGKKTSQPSGGVGQNSGFSSFHIGMSFLVIFTLWLLSGIYIVNQDEQAVILRLGRFLTVAGPGPHWVPRFIDQVNKINVQKVHSYSYNAEMLTADENIVSVAIKVQYRIDDPKAFLFKVSNPIESLKQSSASALRQVIGQTDLDNALTIGREKIADEVQQTLTELMKKYQTGIAIFAVTLQAIQPPEQVTDAFDDAIKAREDKQRYINQAMAYQSRIIPEAKGSAARMLDDAKGYQQQTINDAYGNTARFNALLTQYAKAKQLTRERLYIDAMEAVFGNTTKVLIDGNAGNNLLYLPMDKLIPDLDKQKKLPEPSLINKSQAAGVLPEPNIEAQAIRSHAREGR